MRKTYNLDDAYAAYVEQYRKIEKGIRAVGGDPLLEMKKPQFERYLNNKIKEIKARGGKPSSKIKLAKTIANEYTYRSSAKEVAKFKENVKAHTLKDVFGTRLAEERPDVYYKMKNFHKMKVNQLRAYSYRDLLKYSGLDDAIDFAEKLAEEEGLDVDETREFITQSIFGSK